MRDKGPGYVKAKRCTLGPSGWKLLSLILVLGSLCRSASLFLDISLQHANRCLWVGNLQNAANELFLSELVMHLFQYGEWLDCKPFEAENVFLHKRLQRTSRPRSPVEE